MYSDGLRIAGASKNGSARMTVRRANSMYFYRKIPMTPDDEFNKMSAEYANRVLEALQTHGKRGAVTEALTPLMNRMMRSVDSLTFLFHKNPNNPQSHAALLLSSTYHAP